MTTSKLFQCQYRNVNNKPVIYTFERDNENNKKTTKISDFIPYCYIDVEILSNQISPQIKEISSNIYKTVFGRDVKKCYVKTPSDIYKLKEFYKDVSKKNIYENIYEASILYDQRYIIDNIDNIDKSNVKIIYWDIETTVDSGFPKFDSPIEKITCISLIDSYDKKLVTFVFREDQEERVENNIYYFRDEKNMLNAFINYWHNLDGDVVFAWNGNFDMKYLIVRCRELDINYQKLSKFSEDIGQFNSFFSKEGELLNQPVIIRTKGEVDILGMVIIDELKAYRQLKFNELKSYSLNSIAEEELGEQKEKVYNTSTVWREDLSKLISYNRKDVELIYKIDNKCRLFNILDEIRRFAGLRNINDVFFASRVHKVRILKKYHNQLVFPTEMPFHEKTEEERIEGAFVKEPIQGIHYNVLTFDMKSLYPSLTYSFNLSPEMINKDGIDIGNGTKIIQYPKGVMPNMISDLVKLKDKMKEDAINDVNMSQSVEDFLFSIKKTINSVYGVMSLPSFMLHKKEIAECITYLGRTIIIRCSKKIEDVLGYQVIYNDTDSIFIKIKEEEDYIEKGKLIQNLLNNELKEIAKEFGCIDSIMFIEFEKVFSKLLLLKKKRYCGLICYNDGKIIDKIKFVGVQQRRSDTSLYGKKIQAGLLNIILREKNYKENAISYIKKTIDDIFSNKVIIDEIAIPVKLNSSPEEYKVQNTPKLRGIRFSNKYLGTKFQSGTKFLMIYVVHPKTDVVCFEDVDILKDIKIDYLTMVEKNIFQKIRGIFETLNWNKEFENLQLFAKHKLSGQKLLI